MVHFETIYQKWLFHVVWLYHISLPKGSFEQFPRFFFRYVMLMMTHSFFQVTRQPEGVMLSALFCGPTAESQDIYSKESDQARPVQ